MISTARTSTPNQASELLFDKFLVHLFHSFYGFASMPPKGSDPKKRAIHEAVAAKNLDAAMAAYEVLKLASGLPKIDTFNALIYCAAAVSAMVCEPAWQL